MYIRGDMVSEVMNSQLRLASLHKRPIQQGINLHDRSLGHVRAIGHGYEALVAPACLHE